MSITKIAIVFGFSEAGEYLAKRLLLSFYEHVTKHSSKKCNIEIFPYKCNFKVNAIKDFGRAMNHQEIDPIESSYQFEPFEKEINWGNIPFKINQKDCSDKEFYKFFLPDVAVYHDFAVKYSSQFDIVLYCHNDIVFQPSKLNALDQWLSILHFDSEYSIITELRAIANYDISVRFHMCFVAVNVQKFILSSLSFVNDYVLMDGNKFFVYGNGGTGLLASLYAKVPNKPKWKPYIINTHGIYRNIEIVTEDKWFAHVGGMEWNRTSPMSEGSSIERTQKEYQKAEFYVYNYLKRNDI